jgi:hypothetical protein
MQRGDRVHRLLERVRHIAHRQRAPHPERELHLGDPHRVALERHDRAGREHAIAQAIGPSTLMCRWPATLVAAIFQPTTGWPERSASEACTA